MKTVRWKKYAETYYLPMQEDNLTCMPEGNYSGTYVLASEAQVLEAALREIVEDHDAYCEHHINVSQHSYDLVRIAVQALEVK